jgi:hypothetical protein
MSPETNRPGENDPIKRFFKWKEATSQEIPNMDTEQFKAFVNDLNGKMNQIYDVLMFPVHHGRLPTAEEVDQLLNPHKLAGHEEIDHFIEDSPDSQE